MSESTAPTAAPGGIELLRLLLRHLPLLVLAPLLAGAAAVGISYLVPKTYTARTSFLPPQQAQSAAANALASLGALSGLIGAPGAVRTPADQYVALLQSTRVADRLIEQFELLSVYDEKLRVDAREQLAERTRIWVGKKDGLINVEVDDHDPQRAAAMANRHVDELRAMTGQLALTEAQQRRVFFEAQLAQTRDRLTQAQQALEGSGFNAGALRAEPKAAAEGYARLKAEATAAEVRLQTLRRGFADGTPEVQQQLSVLGALRTQLARQESSPAAGGDADYVGRYREFKYQESLFELLARQYELARLDESREGALIQVVDAATPPEKKSRPRRAFIGAVTAVGVLLALVAGLLLREAWRTAKVAPETADEAERLRAALRR